MNHLNQLDKHNIPQHVAIIMDGNGRWAKQKGEERIFGHTYGVESVREALTAATEAGVKFLTLYAFSTENWNRPKEEVDALMDLLVKTIANEIKSLNENEVRLMAIGDTENLPASCRKALQTAMEETKNNTRITLVLALSYSSKWEITRAVKSIAEKVKKGEIDTADINESLLATHLQTSHIPDPELLIRTSGEHRISNFLLWQLAYSEFVFFDLMWPDFKKEHFYQAIYEYQKRERRFGMVTEQLGNKISH
ncbi:MAG TPA: isoprenyl transferase [Flavobacteriales bacterium]|nr:isoprenyl transferase [Flavobacteriales bacterium]